MNNPGSKYSAFTPKATTLRLHEDVVNVSGNLPEWLQTAVLDVVYRANRPKIVKGITLFDPTRVQV